MTLKPYPERYTQYQPSETTTVIPPVKVTVPTTYRPTRSGYETRGSYSGVGSGGSSSISSPIQKIPEVKKEEPKPKPLPIPKLPPSQKERRERDLISKGLRIKGKRIQGILKRQIIYSPKSKIEYKKTIQEMSIKKKKQIIKKQIKLEKKEKEIEKINNQKELAEKLKLYQIYLQTIKQKEQKPIKELLSPIKLSEEIPSKIKIKWW